MKSNITIAMYRKGNNWGDIVSNELVRFITGTVPNNVHIYSPGDQHYYLVAGSLLQCATRNAEVWGTGLISSNPPKETPLRIHAVRGPKTREVLLKEGISCPPVYGDPALLISSFYKSKVKKKFDIGIVPHYIDKNLPWVKYVSYASGVTVIDITSGVSNVIDRVNECRMIASSSLHGLIVADAYDIPSVWIELSKKLSGGRFKFLDYIESVGKVDRAPLVVTENTKMEEICNKFNNKSIYENVYRLCSELLKVCPFRK